MTASPGERQQVREACAGYFGGPLVTTTEGGRYFQGGPLGAYGLGTAFAYRPKGVPDPFYTIGWPPGPANSWGAIMALTAFARQRQRESLGGWFQHWYRVTATLTVISEVRHVETAESGLDNLLDAMLALLYADPTLGTTDGDSRLITEAGENPFGAAASGVAGRDDSPAFQPLQNMTTGEYDTRGRWIGAATFEFWALVGVLVQPPAPFPP